MERTTEFTDVNDIIAFAYDVDPAFQDEVSVDTIRACGWHLMYNTPYERDGAEIRQFIDELYAACGTVAPR